MKTVFHSLFSVLPFYNISLKLFLFHKFSILHLLGKKYIFQSLHVAVEWQGYGKQVFKTSWLSGILGEKSLHGYMSWMVVIPQSLSSIWQTCMFQIKICLAECYISFQLLGKNIFYLKQWQFKYLMILGNYEKNEYLRTGKIGCTLSKVLQLNRTNKMSLSLFLSLSL
jgi:hypothetical protein